MLEEIQSRTRKNKSPNNTRAAAAAAAAADRRRLRHLRSIAARNVVNRNHSPLLDTYFTLHLCSDNHISRDFYKSEVIQDSLNPTWRSLDFAMLPDMLDTSVSCFVVRIWGGREEQYQLLIEWKVNLDGLRYTGPQIRSRCPNEIIFGLNDGYYAADMDQKENSERKKNLLLQVDQSSVRNSYSVFSLLRLHTAQKAIKQTQVTVQKIGKEIEEKLRTTAACTERKKERECMQLRIGVLRSEVERQRKALLREKETLQKETALLQKKGEAYRCKQQTLDLERDSLTDLQKESTAKRELFLKSSAQLTFRCRQLLSELSYIYPIDTNSQSDFMICGVKLPNSEDFQAKDDGSVAVALGYTAHLVLMISCFLQIPLRYPIMHRGSRSSVRDTITDKLSEKEREFPLYPRGERFHFEYGVYLLNKNIAQLRYQHGLSTPDLRQTLPNLKNFLEHGLLVRCDRHQVSSSIPVPVRSHLSVTQVASAVSPEADKKKRRSYKLYDPVVTPLPEATANQEASPYCLDVSMELEKTLSETDGQAEAAGTSTPEPNPRQYDPDVEKIPERDLELFEVPRESECVEENLQHQGAMNGSAGVPAGAEVCCSVEQAEEIMGTEATGLGLGSRMEDFPCIPVEHAVAVESDDQVLGELENFEEFSKRICALNEKPSCFRRPRKNSDK